jgi:hypothetical protein
MSSHIHSDKPIILSHRMILSPSMEEVEIIRRGHFPNSVVVEFVGEKKFQTEVYIEELQEIGT